MITLSKMMFKRDVDSETGDFVLRYRGPGKWIGRLYGYGLDVFFTVSSRDLPYPEELRPLVDHVGISLDKHPLIIPFRTTVIEALMTEALVQAPELLQEYVEQPTAWLESVGLTLERDHVRALERVRGIVDEIRADLRRRISVRERLASPALPESEPVLPEPEPALSQPTIISDTPKALLQKVETSIREAREAELPQRLPTGVRRALSKMAAGTYLIDGETKEIWLCSNSSDLGIIDGKSASMSRKHEVIVVSWDTEWPVVVRKFGPEGIVVYKVEQALTRAGVDHARSV